MHLENLNHYKYPKHFCLEKICAKLFSFDQKVRIKVVGSFNWYS
jgi:hypothetical protein